MSAEIVMPRLSDSMEAGTITRWLVSEGTEVKEGEPLVEVETDKASVTYESEHEGTLVRIAAGEGESVPVGGVIAVISSNGEGEPSPKAKEGVQSSAGSGAAEPRERSAARSGRGDAPSPAVVRKASGVSPAVAAPAGGRVKASPLARRIAGELGIDLAELTGSGPQGRVTRADVERRAAAGKAPPGRKTEGARGPSTLHSLSRLQQTVARRMAESRATIPDFELRSEVDMRGAVALREQLREQCDPPPSFNDLIVKAVGLALREFPNVNASYRQDAVERHGRFNVGIAVAAEDALVVPTIFDADTRSLLEIAAEARRLAERVRDGTVSPAELAGGTFTVSNLGMYGLDDFSAVVNPPQAAILAVGSVKPRAVVDEASGEVVARPTARLSLSCDHRVLYGADAARFLERVRALLEKPIALLL